MSIAMPAVDQTVRDAPAAEATPGATSRAAAQADRPHVLPNGRLRITNLSDADRNFALAMHLTPFAVFFFFPLLFTPLVLWVIRKDKSTFIDDHGREIINFLITYVVLGVVFWWTFVIPVWLGIVGGINMIRGAVASSNGEFFRYPMVIRFFK